MYGFDGNLSPEDWVKLGLDPAGLSPEDRKALQEKGLLDARGQYIPPRQNVRPPKPDSP